MTTTFYKTTDGNKVLIEDIDGRTQATLRADSPAEAVFMRGLGVIPDVRLVCLETGVELIPAIDYKPIFPDGFDRFRQEGGEFGQ